MKTIGIALTSAVAATMIWTASPANAASWMIGDNDGYGAGICDNCDHDFNGYTANWDGRSAAEKLATDGAQYTDTYSTTHPGYGPQDGTVATFSFAGLGSGWTVGHLEIDAADFQASIFGSVKTTFNGIAIPFGFDDGFPHTAIHFWNLSADVISSINTLGSLTIAIDRDQSLDFYGFDYLKLSNVTAPIPEPETYAMMLAGLGLLGFVARRRKQKAVA